MEKNSLKFQVAVAEDLIQIAEIEQEFFPGYERAFTEEFLKKWFEHNKDMFYVVKSSAGVVQAFIVLVPVDEQLYDELLQGLKSDLYDFEMEHVLTSLNSEYYYIADICISKKAEKYIRTAEKLMVGAAGVIYSHANRVTTSPITPEGNQMCKHLGFKEVAKQEFNGEYYSVQELIIPKKMEEKDTPKAFQKTFKEKRKRDK